MTAERHIRDMRTETRSERAAHDVVRWRREQLAGSGFPLLLATRLAGDPGYDLHALIELSRNALYKTLHDARRKLRVHFGELGLSLASLEEGS